MPLETSCWPACERLLLSTAGHDQDIEDRHFHLSEFVTMLFNIATWDNLYITRFLFAIFDPCGVGRVSKVGVIVRRHLEVAVADRVDLAFDGREPTLLHLCRARLPRVMCRHRAWR